MDDDHRLDQKVVLLRSAPPKPRLPPRLEEMRQILKEAETEPEVTSALVDDDLSDERVIANEGKFRKRFGPGFTWNSFHRKALIELKHEKDLTDPEIRLFHWSGNLRRTPFGVTLAASGWIALWGGVLLTPFLMLFLALLIAAWPNLHGATLVALQAVIGLSLLGVLCYAIYWFHIEPWRIQRRAERQKGACAKTTAATPM